METLLMVGFAVALVGFVVFAVLYFVSRRESARLAAEKELAIRLAVAAMPDKRRRIFEMSRYEGKSNSEIAAALNISKKTVENQISLALAQLKKLVGAIVAFGIFTSV